jgi:hypothetical protein
LFKVSLAEIVLVKKKDKCLSLSEKEFIKWAGLEKPNFMHVEFTKKTSVTLVKKILRIVAPKNENKKDIEL